MGMEILNTLGEVAQNAPKNLVTFLNNRKIVNTSSVMPVLNDTLRRNENHIPNGEPSINDNERDVYLVSRAVRFGGDNQQVAKMIEQIVAKLYRERKESAPDPTQHWFLIVGDYIHELQASGMLTGENSYHNKLAKNEDQSEFTSTKIGTTRFNDVAMRYAATEVINSMDLKYDMLFANCQLYALKLLDRVLLSTRTRMFQTMNHFDAIMKEEVWEHPREKIIITKLDGSEPETIEVGGPSTTKTEESATTETEQPMTAEKEEPAAPLDIQPVQASAEPTEIKISPVVVSTEADDGEEEAEEKRQALINAINTMNSQTPRLGGPPPVAA